MKLNKERMQVSPVSHYYILVSMDELIRLGAVIDCQKKSIYFSK